MPSIYKNIIRICVCRLRYKRKIKKYTFDKLNIICGSANLTAGTLFYGEFKKLFKQFHLPGSENDITLLFMNSIEITRKYNEIGITSV